MRRFIPYRRHWCFIDILALSGLKWLRRLFRILAIMIDVFAVRWPNEMKAPPNICHDSQTTGHSGINFDMKRISADQRRNDIPTSAKQQCPLIFTLFINNYFWRLLPVMVKSGRFQTRLMTPDRMKRLMLEWIFEWLAGAYLFLVVSSVAVTYARCWYTASIICRREYFAWLWPLYL